MTNIISTLIVLCVIVEFILIAQYVYSLLVSLNSDIFNGLTKALSLRFFGGILLHLYNSVSLIWLFISTSSGHDVPRPYSVLLFLMSFLMILTLLGGVNTYFYYFIKRQVKNANETLRNNKSSGDPSIEFAYKQQSTSGTE